MAEGSLTDEQLVHDWITGRREAAAEALYGRYARSLLGYFRKIFESTEVSLELVQETFHQAFRSLDGFRFDCTFRTWLFEIARNSAKKRQRYEIADKRQAIEVPIHEIDWAGEEGEITLALVDPNGGDNPLEQILARESCHQLRAAIRSLTPEDRRMVRFCLSQRLSQSEIADVLKIPVGTVKSRWSRIRTTLRRKLAPHYTKLPF